MPKFIYLEINEESKQSWECVLNTIRNEIGNSVRVVSISPTKESLIDDMTSDE